MALKKTTKKSATKKIVAKKSPFKKSTKKSSSRVSIVRKAVKPETKISLEELFKEIDAVFASEGSVGHVHEYTPSQTTDVDAQLSQLFDEIFADDDKKEVSLDDLFEDLDDVVPTQEPVVKPVNLDELFAQLDTTTSIASDVAIDPQPVTPAYTSILTPTQPKDDELEKEGEEELLVAQEEHEADVFAGLRKFALSVGVAIVALAIGFTWLKVTQASYSQKKAAQDALIPLELQAQWQQIRNDAIDRQNDIQNLISDAKQELAQ